MADETSKVTPTLTLEPEEKEFNFSFAEPKRENMEIQVLKEESVASAGAIDESMLSEEEKKKVDEFVKAIDVTDVKLLNSYGSSAQKGISAFSASITDAVKLKDAGDVGQSLRELRSAIDSTIVPEKKGLMGLFQKGKQKVKYVISNYETAETNIRRIEKDLQKHQQVLTKDIYVFDQMYELNLGFYKELTMYIIAGKKALEQARKTKLPDLQAKAESTGDQLDVQVYRDFESSCRRFEKRLHALETNRLVAIQLAPQIRVLQDANQETVDRLQSSVINTIPLWRNQMVLALGLDRTNRALKAQSAVDEMTNEMMIRNAETLRQGAIDAALASERDIVDIETLKKVNADIITSINEVVRIHEEGAKKRAEAQVEFGRIETELKTALLEAGNR